MCTHGYVDVHSSGVHLCACITVFLQKQITVVYIILLHQVCNGSCYAMHCVGENDDVPKCLQSKYIRLEVTGCIFCSL